MTDTIVNMGYFRTLLAELAARHAPYEIFFECRSNLTEEQMRTFADADAVRSRLKVSGIILEDGPKGTTWRREIK